MASASRRSGRIATIESNRAELAQSRKPKPPVHPKADEGCTHPANVWFKDPRQPTPPRLPSRAAILRKVFLEHAQLTGIFCDILDNYVAGDDPELLPQEEQASRRPLFPKFMFLPAEIRHYIWQLAVPQRILDVRNVKWPSYTRTACQRLPVPYIARVCREAREVVLRMGFRMALYEDFDGPASDSAYDSKNHPAGFVTTKDTLFYSMGTFKGVDGMINEGHCDAENLKLLTAGEALTTLNATEVCVSWGNPHGQYMYMFPSAESNPYFLRKVEAWKFLTRCQGLKRIFVETRSHLASYNDITLLMSKKIPPQEDYMIFVDLLVDLYDDQTLAEIASLETAGTDDNRPRYIAWTQAKPWGPCMNCEREIWERDHKSAVENFWLHLHGDEIDDQVREEIFPGDRPYNPVHPWVLEKLSRAPEFRPAMVVGLRGRTLDELQGDSDDEEEEEEGEEMDDSEDETYGG